MAKYGAFVHVNVDGEKCGHYGSNQAEIDADDEKSSPCIAECEREKSPFRTASKFVFAFTWSNSQKHCDQVSQKHVKITYFCTTCKIPGLSAPQPHSVPDNWLSKKLLSPQLDYQKEP